MRTYWIAGLFMAFLMTSGSSCKKEEAPQSQEEQAMPTTPPGDPAAKNEQGTQVPSPDESNSGAANEAQGLGESAEVRDSGPQED